MLLPRTIACFPLALTLGVSLASSAAVDWQTGPGFRSLAVEPGKTNRDAPFGKFAVGFSEMPGLLTGIQFSNTLPLRLMTENQNLMLGSGVAAGDFNGDGWCDLYFCAINGTNALYRNREGWRFEDVTTLAGVGMAGLHSTGAIFADIDGDGDLDLLVATLGNGVHTFVTEGSGRFRETTREAGLAAQTGSTSLAMADVDGDGTLDLYVANYGALSILRSGGSAEMKKVGEQWVLTGPYASRLRYIDGRLEEVGEPDALYLNDGRGHFRPVPWNSDFFLDENGKPMPEPWDYGLAVQIRDINGDGFPDIYVCNDFQTVDRIWLNDGRGRFRALPRLAMRKQSFSSMGVDFADVDRDGFLDFFVTEMMAREHALRMRQLVGMQPAFPVHGRIDNRPDVARNTFFRNRGDGTYAEMANFSGVAASDWSWQPVFLDVDLDGYEDLLVVNGAAFDVQDRDVLNRIRSLGRQSPEQSRTNLLLYPPWLSPNVAYRNRRDLTFEDVSATWGFDSRRVSHGVALADLDNDGDLDVVVNCLNAPPLLYRNNATGPRLGVRLNGKSPNRHGIGAMIRVRCDPAPVQMQEIICGGRYLSGDDTMRVFATGGGTNDSTIEVRWRSGKSSVVRGAKANRVYAIEEPDEGAAAVASLDDQRREREQRSEAPLFEDVTRLLGHAHHEEQFNDYARQPLLMKQLSQLGPGVAWIDLDGDGHEDLIIGSGRNGQLAVFRNDGRGGFSRLIAPALAKAVPGDLTGVVSWTAKETERSILVGMSNYEMEKTNASEILRYDFQGGELRTDPQSAIRLPDSIGPLAVADIDGDGDLDLFVGGRVIPGAYPQAATSRIFRQENGKLQPDAVNDRVLNDVGLVSGAVWSDLDGDGYPELVLACEWGPVRVFKNERGRLREATRELGLELFTGWWNGVTIGDFDEDGRLDIIAGNWGLNTGYEASREHPLELYYGNIGGSGMVDLIEAYYAPELKAVVPRRTLNALSQAFPMLAERYPTHQTFSVATIADLLGVLPRSPQAVTARTLSTTLFLNRGTNFVAVPLPAEAQLAPAFGVNVADADGDGHEDVFLSQNFFAMRPELPRLDGGRGLWLRGDGKGHFIPMPGQESGVMVYGEQRGAALGDFNEDGRVDLVVAQNGAASRVFENKGARPGLRVRLQGPHGNPSGVGAMVRLQFGQRMGPAREFHAGAGYWSQDSLVPVMGCPEPATQLHVLWPGGKRVTATIPPGSREVVVDERGNLQLLRRAAEKP